ncbi:MAG: toll/interleukin-1 receptor domain-containing protein [Propionibacteriaceae bacterium]|jgi:hypothetical protein|nr:toll/interleukin-1 receptor domain-containing protein [Propionibacteriaceae bacterium]
MSPSAERPYIRVFLSYRRIDNPKQGAFPGKVSAFRDDLANTIAREIGLRNVQVFMDTDPETMIGDRSWRDKILKELHQTTVFVSIMTANYLDSESDHACTWEFREYQKVYEADPDRHSLITVQLCAPEVAADALSGPDWQALGSQELIGYVKCRTAWDDGQGYATWNNLIREVSDAIIAFARKAASPPPPVSQASTVPSEGSPPSKDNKVLWNLMTRLQISSAYLCRALRFRVNLDDLQNSVDLLRLATRETPNDVFVALCLAKAINRLSSPEYPQKSNETRGIELSNLARLFPAYPQLQNLASPTIAATGATKILDTVQNEALGDYFANDFRHSVPDPRTLRISVERLRACVASYPDDVFMSFLLMDAISHFRLSEITTSMGDDLDREITKIAQRFPHNAQITEFASQMAIVGWPLS